MLLVLFPNPTRNFLFIKGIDEIAQITIFNVEGKKVIDCSVNFNKVDISQLGTGLYAVVIKTKTNSFIRKVCKID